MLRTDREHGPVDPEDVSDPAPITTGEVELLRAIFGEDVVIRDLARRLRPDPPPPLWARVRAKLRRRG